MPAASWRPTYAGQASERIWWLWERKRAAWQPGMRTTRPDRGSPCARTPERRAPSSDRSLLKRIKKDSRGIWVFEGRSSLTKHDSLPRSMDRVFLSLSLFERRETILYFDARKKKEKDENVNSDGICVSPRITTRKGEESWSEEEKGNV